MSILTIELLVKSHVALLRDLGGTADACDFVQHLYESEYGVHKMLKACKETYTRITQEGLSSLDHPNSMLEMYLSSLVDYNALVFVTFPLRFTIGEYNWVIADQGEYPFFTESTRIYESCVANFSDAAASFDSLQSEIRKRDLVGYPRWLIADISFWLERLLEGYHPIGKCTLPPGACVGASTDIVDRINRIYETSDDWKMYNTDKDTWDRTLTPPLRKNVCRVQVVPKDAFRGRLIAPDGLTRQYYARPMMRGLIDCCKRAKRYGVIIDISDQTRNQMAALAGSEGYDWCTIDHHAASDSWSAELVREVWPSSIVDIHPYLPTHYITANKQCKRLYSFAPSGNVLTFPCESLLHASLFLCAVCYTEMYTKGFVASRRSRKDFFEQFADELLRRGEGNPILYFYGDDGIGYSKYFQTYDDLAQMIGLVVNEDKSFYNNNYLFRESCGSFFYCGSPIDLVRWPRKNFPIVIRGGDEQNHRLDVEREYFEPKDESVLESLISLQNALWVRSYHRSAHVLEQALNQLGISTIKPVGYVDPGCKCCYGFVDQQIVYYTLGEVTCYKRTDLTVMVPKWRESAVFNVEDPVCGYRPERLTTYTAFDTKFLTYRDILGHTVLDRDGYRYVGEKCVPQHEGKVTNCYFYQREVKYSTLEELKESLLGRGFRHGDKIMVYAAVRQPQNKVVVNSSHESYSELAAYQYYLEHGPQYEDELSRLLRVTAPLKWRYGYKSSTSVMTSLVGYTLIL